MKTLLILVALALLVIHNRAQTTVVEITGGEKLENTFPLNSSAPHLYSAELYLAKEINIDGNITSIAFYQSSGCSCTKTPCRIYLATTESTTLPSTDWAELSGKATLVFDGVYCFDNAIGWREFILDVPFSYNSTANLLVLCESDPGGTGTKGNEGYFHFASSKRSASAAGGEPPPSTLKLEEMTSWIHLTFGPLPVQLTSFTAKTSGSDITLMWHTASEMNNYGFFVQCKGRNELCFSDIPGSFIAGHGTTVMENSYRYSYTGACASDTWFRLKQVDLDGSLHFSEPIALCATNVRDLSTVHHVLLQNYPNPFNPSTSICFSLPCASDVVLSIFNTLGEEMAQLVNGHMEAGFHETKFRFPNLPSGVYIYRLKAGGYAESKTMQLMR